jgi:hypothetical protein
MTRSRRLRALEAAAPPPAPGRGEAVPADPVAFARRLLAGAFGPADLDPADPRHTGWLVRVVTFLWTLGDEHQQWLRRARELDPRAYPDQLLMPASNEAVLAALDAVMRRG